MWVSIVGWWLFSGEAAEPVGWWLDTVEELSTPAIAALGLLSYLLGSLMLPIAQWLARWLAIRGQRLAVEERSYWVRVQNAGLPRATSPIERWNTWRRRAAWFFVPLRENGVSRVYSRLRLLTEGNVPVEQVLPPEFLSRANHPSGDVDDASDMALWHFTNAVFQDLLKKDLSTRLLSATDLHVMFQEYTREKSEAELRLALALPLPALGFVFGASSPMLTTIGLVALALAAASALFVQGVSRLKSAGDIVAVAVGDSLISTPTLELADWWIDRKAVSGADGEPG